MAGQNMTEQVNVGLKKIRKKKSLEVLIETGQENALEEYSRNRIWEMCKAEHGRTGQEGIIVWGKIRKAERDRGQGCIENDRVNQNNTLCREGGDRRGRGR